MREKLNWIPNEFTLEVNVAIRLDRIPNHVILEINVLIRLNRMPNQVDIITQCERHIESDT